MIHHFKQLPLRRAITAGCAALALSLTAAPASAADEDLQQWTLLILQQKLSDRWLGYFEVQPRLGQDVNGMERLLVRPAFGYRLNPKLSVWQGYAWTPLITPTFAHEHRPFQQLLYEDTFGSTGFMNRARLEERFIEGADGVSLRFRNMVRLAHPISRDKRWAVVGYDELFWNLNSTSGGPVSGFDQNRLFIGISRQVNREFRVETGYLLNIIDAPRTSPNRRLHVWVTSFVLNL